jgi:Protein of unknown function (DUF4043)
MAVTQVSINNQLIKWRKDTYREWRRGNFFSPYMGDSPNSIIQVTRELRDGGDVLNIPIVAALRGPGVSTGPLVGNEEKMINYGMRLWVDWSRNAVLLTRAQMRKSSFEQMELVRPLLTEWQNCLLRDEIVLAFFSLPAETPPANLGNEALGGQRVNGILYDASTAQQRNDWQAANADRILYGSKSKAPNFIAGNHDGSLATLSATNDKATAAILLLGKRIARRANPGISPYRESETKGRETFVAFCGQNAFRDLAADPVIYNANIQARERNVETNPVFQDGDLIYRGIIIREVPEIDDFCTLPNAGSAVDVAPIFLCGQNAVALGWGQMPKPTERAEDDYGMIIGRGVESVYGVGKVFTARDPDATSKQLVQWGMVTIFVASPPDA